MAVTAPTWIPAAVRRAASSVASAGSPEPSRMSTVAGAPCSDPSLHPVVGGGVADAGAADDGGGLDGSADAGAVDDGGGLGGAVDDEGGLDGGGADGGGVDGGGVDGGGVDGAAVVTESEVCGAGVSAVGAGVSAVGAGVSAVGAGASAVG